MIKINSIIKKSLLYGFLFSILILILLKLILSLNLELFKSFSIFISSIFISLVFIGGIFSLMIPVSFFLLSSSIIFLFLYYKKKRGNDKISNSEKNYFYVALVLIVIIIIGSLIIILAMPLISISQEFTRQQMMQENIISSPEKANEYFEKAIKEEDYETIEDIAWIGIVPEVKLPESLIRKIYLYGENNKEILLTKPVKHFNYYNRIMSSLSCSRKTPLDIRLEIYKQGNANEGCIKDHPDIPEEVRAEIINRVVYK